MTKEEKDKIFLNNHALIRNTARKAQTDFRLKTIEVDDVVQDTYLKWILSTYNLEGSVTPVEYIINIIYQIFIDQQRKLTKRVESSGIDIIEEPKVVDQMTADKVFSIQEEHFRNIDKRFNSEERNLAISKLIREGWNNKDIAFKLGISEMAVKNFKTKFVKRAKEKL